MNNNNTYFKVYDVFVRELKLKGNDLLIYSAIYSMGGFTGNLYYLSQITGCTTRSVYNSIITLAEMDLIVLRKMTSEEQLFHPKYRRRIIEIKSNKTTEKLKKA